MQTSSQTFEVVLWGIGHTNAYVLRGWRTTPIPGAQLTCVSDGSTATYSGMLPGVLAGQYGRERMEIDLARLCDAAGARLIVGEVTGLDLAGRRLRLASHPALPFDALSIGIGSVPSRNGADLDEEAVLAIKPMLTFLDRLDERLRLLGPQLGGRPLRVVVVGGGAGGIEIAFCLPRYVRRFLGDVPVELTLVETRERIAVGLRAKTAAMVRRALEARGVRLRLGRRVTRVARRTVTLDDGEELSAELVLWATGARGPSILAKLSLPTDDRGFLLARPTLQVLADAPIFVVGDSGTIQEYPTPKAGVYAVKQGPILWKNLTRLRERRPLVPYRPQRGFLKLLNTGDGSAIGEFDGFSFQGRWCWALKDFIDRRFVDEYRIDESKLPADPGGSPQDFQAV
jgi:selenide, water dikinase